MFCYMSATERGKSITRSPNVYIYSTSIKLDDLTLDVLRYS